MKKTLKKNLKPLLLSAEGILLGALVVIFLVNADFPSAAERDEMYIRETEAMSLYLRQTAEAFQSSPTAEPSTAEEVPLVETEPTMIPVLSAEDYYLANTSEESYAAWIRKLSGAEPISVGGIEYTVQTRYSYAMFGGKDNAKAYDWLLETLKQWIPESQISLEPYTYETSPQPWYNVVVTFPGTVKADEQVLFTAHLDSCVSTEGKDPMELAPGADDNGTGLAALLEAIPLFTKIPFERTVKVVFFTGEENFQSGSKAYAQAHGGENIVGVMNMDMFGNDSDGDRCFEIHVGELEGSNTIGTLLKQAIADHQIPLIYDYFPYEIHENKIQGDHTPFWNQQIPAVTVMENFSAASSEGGCGQGVTDDIGLTWHVVTDTFENVKVPYAFDIAKAGTITVLRLAGAGSVAAD